MSRVASMPENAEISGASRLRQMMTAVLAVWRVNPAHA
jgi:hypothetical protein